MSNGNDYDSEDETVEEPKQSFVTYTQKNRGPKKQAFVTYSSATEDVALPEERPLPLRTGDLDVSAPSPVGQEKDIRRDARLRWARNKIAGITGEFQGVPKAAPVPAPETAGGDYDVPGQPLYPAGDYPALQPPPPEKTVGQKWQRIIAGMAGVSGPHEPRHTWTPEESAAVREFHEAGAAGPTTEIPGTPVRPGVPIFPNKKLGEGVTTATSEPQTLSEAALTPEWRRGAEMAYGKTGTKIVAGAAKGFLDFSEGMASPENVALLGSIPGVAAVMKAKYGPAGEKMAHQLINGKFSVDMLENLVKNRIPALTEAVKKGDPEAIAENLMAGAFDAGFTAANVQGALGTRIGTAQPAIERIRGRLDALNAKTDVVENPPKVGEPQAGLSPRPAETPLEELQRKTQAIAPKAENLEELHRATQAIGPEAAPLGGELALEELKRATQELGPPAAPVGLDELQLATQAIAPKRPEGAPMAFDIEEVPGAQPSLIAPESKLFPPTGRPNRFKRLQTVAPPKPRFTSLEDVPGEPKNRITFAEEPAPEAPAPAEPPVQPQTPPLEAQAPIPVAPVEPTPIAPKGPGFGSRLKVHLGMNGARDVQFPDANHADLFSLSGRFKRQTRGQGGPKPDAEGVAARLGIDPRDVSRVAKEYRDSVMAAAKETAEGGVVTAPKFEEVTTPPPASKVKAWAAEDKLKALEAEKGALFSRGEGEGGVNLETAKAAADAVAQELPGIKVKVHKSATEMQVESDRDTELQRGVTKERAAGHVVEAFFDPVTNTLHVFADEMPTSVATASKTLHEAVHRGLELAVPSERKAEIERQVGASDVTKEFLKTDVGQAYLGEEPGAQAQEPIARAAEKLISGEAKIPGYFSRTLSGLKEFARAIDPSVKYTEADILKIVNEALMPQLSERPIVAGVGVPRFARQVKPLTDEEHAKLEELVRREIEKKQSTPVEDVLREQQGITPTAEEPRQIRASKATKEPWQMTRAEFEAHGDLVYHGGREAYRISTKPPTSATGNPTSRLGAYFTPDRGEAERYVRAFHGGKGVVQAARLGVVNPYRMSFKEFDDLIGVDWKKLGSPEGMAELSARTDALRSDMIDRGHDGLIVGVPGKSRPQEIIAFNDSAITQHKYAVADALAAGKPVPQEVLAEYPDLTRATNEPKPSRFSKRPEPTPEEIEAAYQKAKPEEKRTIEEELRSRQGITPTAEEPGRVADAIRQQLGMRLSKRGTKEYEDALKVKNPIDIIERKVSIGKDATLEEIGEYWEDWVERHKGRVDIHDFDELQRRGAAMGLQEAMYQLSKKPESARFYSEDLDKAVTILKKLDIIPDNPLKERVFKAILSGSSFGKTPTENLNTAVEVFRTYQKTGQFPEKQKSGKGWGGQPQFGETAQKLNRLLKMTGSEQAMMDWLHADHPISEIRKFASSIGGKGTDMLPGMFIIGPKGGPFALNLMGRMKWLTLDRWQARFGNRMLGNMLAPNKKGEMEMVNSPRGHGERMAHVQFMQNIADKLGLTIAETQSVLWHFEKDLYEALGGPVDKDSYGTAAENMARRARREDAIPVQRAEEAGQGPAAVEPGQGGAGGEGGVRFSKRPAGFYSEVEKAIDEYPEGKLNPDQFLAWLRKRPGVKPTEIEWSGIEKMARTATSKQQIVDAMRAGAPAEAAVTETQYKAPDAEATKAARRRYDQASTGNRLDKEALQRSARAAGLDQPAVANLIYMAGIGEMEHPVIKRALAAGLGREIADYRKSFEDLGAAHRDLTNVSGESPKFEQYILPGPHADYRETTLHMPNLEGEPYEVGAHFPGRNIVVHNRTTERTYADGKTGTNIEEIQSDMNQAGRKEGFGPEGIPENPFQKSEDWALLGFKAALRDAVEKGHDRVTWTTGEQQAERYDLSKQIDTLGYFKDENGKYDILAGKDGRRLIEKRQVPENELEGLVGKELAKKIIAGEKTGTNKRSTSLLKGNSAQTYDVYNTISGLDLKVGGEGMAGFYDKILPAVVNKYVKKWGGKVGEASINNAGGNGPTYPATEISPGKWVLDGDPRHMNETFPTREAALTALGEGNAVVHSVDITPAMRDSVKKGQPMYSKRAATPEDLERGRVKDLNERSEWMVVEATDPGGKTASPEYNARATAELKKDLDRQGIQYEPIRGKYRDIESEPNPGFLVFGKHDPAEWAKKYGQESILTNRGLEYQDGHITPSKGITEHETAPPNFYTEIPRTGAMFTSDLDFDTTRYRGLHAGPLKLDVVKPEFQGTGQMGAERRRLIEGEGQVPYSNWYTTASPVVENHRFGGKHVHEANLDVTNKPGGLIEWPVDKTPAQLKAEGYTGIFFPKEKQAHVFVDMPVEYRGKAAVGGKPVITGAEYEKGVKFSKRAAKPIPDDLLPDVADATLDVDPRNRKAWEKNAISKFGARIKPHLEQVHAEAMKRYPEMEGAGIDTFVDTAERMVEAGVGTGRGLTPIAEGRISNPVDQLMGKPPVEHRTEVQEAAQQLRMDAARREELVRRASDPEDKGDFDPVQDVALRQEIAEMSQSNDPGVIRRLITMTRNYRRGRTKLARQLGTGGMNLDNLDPVQGFRFGLAQLLYGDLGDIPTADFGVAAKEAQRKLSGMKFSKRQEVVPERPKDALDPETYHLMATVGADVLNSGKTSSVAFREEMVKRIGPRVEKYLMTVRAGAEELRSRPPKVEKVSKPEERAMKLMRALEKNGYKNITGWPDEKVVELINNKAEFQRFITVLSTERAGKYRKYVELYRNGLLLAPTTVLANGISNAAHLFMEHAFTKPAAAIVGSIRGGDRTVGDLAPAYKEFPLAVRDAWRNAVGAFLGEYDVDYTGNLRSDPVKQLADILAGRGRGPAIGGRTGRWVRGAQRVQGAVDNFFGTLAANVEALANAREMARREGLKGGERANRVRELFDDHTSEPWQAAEAEASRLMFREEADHLMKVAMGLRSAIPGGELVAPFLATPYNIGKVGLKMTPGAGWLVTVLERRGKGRTWKQAATDPWRAEDIVRPLMGPMIAAVLYNIAALMTDDEKKKGAITPLEKYSREESAEWNLRQGARPQGTIETSRGRLTYQRIDPASKLISAAAAFREAQKAGKSNMKAALEAAGNYLEQVTTIDAMKSLNEVITIMSEKKYDDLIHFVQRNAAAAIPFSSVRRAFADALEDKIPETRIWGATKPADVGETKAARGWRRTGRAVSREFTGEPPPKVTAAGEEMSRGGSVVERFVSPFKTTAFTEGPGTQILRNIIDYNERETAKPFWPGKTNPFWSEEGIQHAMTDQQRHDFEQKIGRMWVEMIMNEAPEIAEPGHKITEEETKLLGTLRRKAGTEVRKSLVE